MRVSIMAPPPVPILGRALAWKVSLSDSAHLGKCDVLDPDPHLEVSVRGPPGPPMCAILAAPSIGIAAKERAHLSGSLAIGQVDTVQRPTVQAALGLPEKSPADPIGHRTPPAAIRHPLRLTMRMVAAKPGEVQSCLQVVLGRKLI